MTTSVVLPDNTVVYLNSESSLRYPSRFVGESREVELIGEAYFDVTKDKERRFCGFYRTSVTNRSIRNQF